MARPGGPRRTPERPLLRLREVTKRFGETLANDAVSVELWPGEVHCLLGENGAGKSTLISVLAGMQQPDSGRIEIDGVQTEITTPAAAHDHGISVVYQHSALIPSMTVLENLMLGASRGIRLDRRGAKDRLAHISELLGAEIAPGLPVSELDLGQRQQLELAKALWSDPRVLVLDEPTSMLTPRATEELLASMEQLAARGVAVLFVTHRLAEAFAVGSRVTVLRAGSVVDEISPGEIGSEQLSSRILEAMFGTTAREAEPADARAQEADRVSVRVPEPAELLTLENVTTREETGSAPITDVSLRVRAGEVLGIAGIDGHGQRHLAEVIAGQRPLVQGRVLFFGRDVSRSSVRQRQRLGIGYVTDDRLHEGIVSGFSVALNLLLKRVGERPFWRFSRMDRSAVDSEAAALIDTYDIRTPSASSRAGTLSGGNIQKILLARELAHAPRLVVFSKPSAGLDLATVRRVQHKIREFVGGGGSAVLISPDIDELLELSDRISVLSNGRLIGEVENRGNSVKERVGAFMTGRPTPASGLPGNSHGGGDAR